MALLLGTISGVLFALGMCMTLLPEWDVFWQGVVFGACGILLGAVTLLLWCKMEHKKLPACSRKNLFRIFYSILALLILGTGMCLCLVWNSIVWGTLVGLLGIVMLLTLIPMIKGLK